MAAVLADSLDPDPGEETWEHLARVIYGLEAIDPPILRSVLTIGNFDGVHRGHQHILAAGTRLSRRTDAPLVALTFEPHPLAIVAPARAPTRLMTNEERVKKLGAAGADIVVVARSEPGLLAMEAEAFAEEVLLGRFHPVSIVVGTDFGFGKGRRGNVDTLRRLGLSRGIEVNVVEPLELNLDGKKQRVSSSLIRSFLLAGEVAHAERCLGRPYGLTGVVERGAGRGVGLGFPTANLAVADVLVPGDGVYAGVARVDTRQFLAAISIGRNPTFGGTGVRVEAHLLDYAGDLYGRSLRIEFTRRIRGQIKFESAQELAAQIARDVAAVREEPFFHAH